MSEGLAQVVVLLFVGYAAIGAVFALVFLKLGARRIDPSVAGSTKGYAVLVFPGVVALWPLLAVKWIGARS